MAQHGRHSGRARRRHLGIVGLFAGVIHRGASTVLILLVALIASAAASTGPAYYTSAKTSILRDTFANASYAERGVEVTLQGAVPHAVGPLAQAVDTALSSALPDAATKRRLFAPAILAIEGTSTFPELSQSVPLAWRTDVCAHLRVTAGRCATAADEVTVSTSLAKLNHWHVGQRLRPTGWPAFTVTGIYSIPNWNADYWFGRGGNYFATEDSSGKFDVNAPPKPDAMFTAQATLDEASGTPQGTLVVDQLVDANAVRGTDLPTLVHAMSALPLDPTLGGEQAAVTTELPGIVSTVHASWKALSVPVFLITIQLLLLVWLLMFIVVGDAIGARGPEIALAKLRGLRGRRLLGFALGEPVALLAIALPAGAGIGYLACAVLDAALLRPGTPVQVPALTWAAAGAATLGGLVATVIAGRRTLRRSVVDQWQHASREATRRSWIPDAILLTAVAGALVELAVSGHIGSVQHGSLALLVPGLLGVAVAVVASRLLPLGCRALFRPTSRRGGLGPFLAVRHVARRTAGVRTTIVLATAFALATFSVASWSTGQSNRRLVADVGVGAPTVLSVSPPSNVDLGALVDKLDPGGTNATVVDNSFTNTAGNESLLAVDPQRFARVAAWHAGFADESLETLMKRIAPSAAPPITLTGNQVRIRMSVQHLAPTGLVLSALLAVPGANGPVYSQLGVINRATGAVTLTATLPSSPCRLTELSLSPAAVPPVQYQIAGTITLTGIDVRDSTGWRALPGIGKSSQWRVTDPSGQVTGSPAGVQWAVHFSSATSANLFSADQPDPLPAVIDTTTAGTGGTQAITLPGLDQNQITVKPVAVVAAVPGASNGGLIVDRTYAERAAAGALSALVTQQVWTTDAAAARISRGLRAAGVKILQTQTAGGQAKLYDRQGPGLASTVFLADAVAAAILAAAGAVLGLVTAARRRRFEYAALEATGARRRSLYWGLLIEQAAVLLFGAVVGALAGVGAALLAVKSVPEFVTTPASPPLAYDLRAGVLAIALGAAVVLLVVVAVVASWALLAGARPEQLREAQQ